MPAKHPEPPQPSKPAPAAAVQTKERKPWKKKSPVEVVLEQEEKLRKDIIEAEADLKEKRSQLQRFEQARKIFEGI